MGWHEQGDGNHMLGVNIEQGRVRDTPELRMKSGFRAVVDNFEGVDMLLTPSQARPHSVACARRVRAVCALCARNAHAMPTCHADMPLPPSQSIVFRNIKPEQKMGVEVRVAT